MNVHFEKTIIIGVGLIGGSLALAGKRKGIFGEVIGVGRSRANLEKALEIGAVDRVVQDVREAVADADLVVLATPVRSIVTLGREIIPTLKKGAVLTDVGSVKQRLVEELEAVLPKGVYLVGAHPIAGSEESGAAAAREDLFVGARTILTPTDKTDPHALARVRALWESVGSLVVEMEVDEHDTVLAAVSHLPHMVAYALVDTLAGMAADYPDISTYAAGGFKDTTRIAASHPEMWRDICQMNKEKVVEVIERYESALEKIKFRIQEDDFSNLTRTFQEARDFRRRL